MTRKKDPEKPPKKPGRPAFDFTKHLAYIEKMAEVGCTNEEIGAVIGCSHDTLERASKDSNSPVSACLSRVRANFKFRLRHRLKYKALHGKNNGPLIFAAKTILRLSEKHAPEDMGGPGGKGGGPIDESNLSPEAVSAIEDWAKRAARSGGTR